MHRFKLLFSGIFFVAAMSGISCDTGVTAYISGSASKTVYLCNGPKSTKYHYDKYCRGLSRCSTEIEKTTQDDAEKRKRTLCGWED